MSWYYCLEHQKVEPEDGCPNAERMGPYESEAAASQAMELAQQRSEAWDSEDDD